MKGQISLDLMMAVLVTLLVLATMFAAINSVKESYQEIFIENQLKKISSEQAAFLTSINALDDISINIELRPPVIYHENRKLNPNIVLDRDTNSLSASVLIRGRNITQTSKFAWPEGAVINYDGNRTLKVIKVA